MSQQITAFNEKIRLVQSVFLGDLQEIDYNEILDSLDDLQEAQFETWS